MSRILEIMEQTLASSEASQEGVRETFKHSPLLPEMMKAMDEFHLKLRKEIEDYVPPADLNVTGSDI